MFNNLSTYADKVDYTFMCILVTCLFFYVLITALLIYFPFRYSRKNHPVAADIEGNLLLEVVWTIIPTFIVLWFFWLGYTSFVDIRQVPEEALNIKVTGRMWSWTFEYDNGEISDKLYAPIGVPVYLDIHSEDVIHSLYIPAFRVKQDAVPGLVTRIYFQANKVGEYDIFCAEYCGTRHAYMLSKCVIQTEEDFKKTIWGEGDLKLAKYKLEAGRAVRTDLAKADTAAVAAPKEQSPTDKGKKLLTVKGCVACHSSDGSKIVGPSFKGIYGKTETVVTDGSERTITVDDEYIKKSILHPNDDVVKGFSPLMPPQPLSDDEIASIIEYLKTLK